MTAFRHIFYCLGLMGWSANPCFAQDSSVPLPASPPVAEINTEQSLLVEHLDPVAVDPNFNLSQLLEQTLEQYPDRLINEGLAQEAEALKTRGDSWLAGSTAITLDYADDRVASDKGSREASANLEFTVWNWGQRSAAQNVADQAQIAANKQSHAVKWEVARLVREALWDMALAESRLQQARNNMTISEQL